MTYCGSSVVRGAVAFIVPAAFTCNLNTTTAIAVNCWAYLTCGAGNTC